MAKSNEKQAEQEIALSPREKAQSELAEVQGQIHSLQRRESVLLAKIDKIILAETPDLSPQSNTANIQAFLAGQHRARIERAERVQRLAALDVLPEDLQVKAPIDAKRRRVSRFASVR